MYGQSRKKAIKKEHVKEIRESKPKEREEKENKMIVDKRIIIDQT
jgi:hypothetical protein